MAFPTLGSFDHAVMSVSTDFPFNLKGDATFHQTAFDYSRVDWDDLRDNLRDVR